MKLGMHGLVGFDRATGDMVQQTYRKSIINIQLEEIVWQGLQRYVVEFIYFNIILHAFEGDMDVIQVYKHQEKFFHPYLG